MSMSMALSSLARYGNNVSTHIKNWRPQIVVFNKLTSDGKIKYPQLLSKFFSIKKSLKIISDFADSLKEGKGLLIIKTILEENFDELMEKDPEATIQIQKTVNEYVKAQDIKTIDTSVVVSLQKTEQKNKKFVGLVKSFKRY